MNITDIIFGFGEKSHFFSGRYSNPIKSQQIDINKNDVCLVYFTIATKTRRVEKQFVFDQISKLNLNLVLMKYNNVVFFSEEYSTQFKNVCRTKMSCD